MFEKADELLLSKKRVNYPKAQKIYEDILNKDADNIDAINSLAQCLQETDPSNEDKIISLYEKSLRLLGSLGPSDFETNFNMALYYYKIMDREKALDILLKLHKTVPEHENN